MSKSFLDGKHVYHRIYVTNDLIALNEKSNFYNSVQMDSVNDTIINGNGLKLEYQKIRKNLLNYKELVLTQK